MGSEEYLYELAYTTSNRVCRMVTRETLDTKTGFRSIYGFAKEACDYFRNIGSVRGAKHFSVFGDELFIDIDNNDEEAGRISDVLTEMGLGFSVYNSGGKGYHIVLKHQPIFDRNLPYSQKEWVRKQGFKSDMCLYTQNHLIRLPRTRHAKTGRYKELEHKVEGALIDLQLVQEPAKVYANGSSDFEFSLEEFAGIISRIASEPPRPGERNNKMFSLCAGILSCGLKFSTVKDIVENLNSSFPDPLEDSELVTIFESAKQMIGG